MKLSDFLSGVGRPVAFYPSLVKALGDRNETIFVCQMAYWRGKGEENDGWIYKESTEIESETYLSYKEQTNVRKGLIEKGMLEEKYARTEHKMYFRVNWDAVNMVWEQFTNGHMPNGHMPSSKVASSQRSDGSLPTVSSLNSNTETTTEITTENERVAWLSKKYSSTFGPIPSITIADQIKDAAESPLPWLEFAFGQLAEKKKKEPVMNGWSYVLAVLKSCRNLGGIPTPADQDGKKTTAAGKVAGIHAALESL